MTGPEADAAARLLERLLVDPALRRRFRHDPVAASREAGVESLAQEMSLASGKAMETLDVRESRSGLAGVFMAAAVEGVAAYELIGEVAPHLQGIPESLGQVLSRVDLPAIPGLPGVDTAQAAGHANDAGEFKAVVPVDAAQYGQEGTGGGPSPEARALLDNNRVTLDADGIADLKAGKIDPRVVSVLAAISKDHEISVSATASDHQKLTSGGSVSNHFHGRALDIAVVDGQPVSPGNEAARKVATSLAGLDPAIRPSEIGSPWALPGPAHFTDAAHQDHLHIAFDDPIARGWTPPDDLAAKGGTAQDAGAAPVDAVPAKDQDEALVKDQDLALDIPQDLGAGPPDDGGGEGAVDDGGGAGDGADEPGGLEDPGGDTDAEADAESDGEGDEDEEEDDEGGESDASDENSAESDASDENSAEADGGSDGDHDDSSDSGSEDTGDSDGSDGGGSDDSGSGHSDSGDSGGGGGAGDPADPGETAKADPADQPINVGDVDASYPGDDAPREAIAAWMGSEAAKRGLPAELPVMAALVESNLRNLDHGHADSVGLFQMRLGTWNEGAYAGYPERGELQLKWFLDQAVAVKQQRVAAGRPVDDPAGYGEWVADVERPAAQYRGRYQLRLADARDLLKDATESRKGGGQGEGGGDDGADAGVEAVAGERAPSAGPRALAALAEAKKHVGTPYRWGGSSPKTGFDCSGLVQWAYAKAGIRIPRVTDQQIAAAGASPVNRRDLVAGDLVFFRDPSGYVHHVGISLGGDRFLHAPHTGDVVKISSLDERYYAQQFAGGRRFDPAGVPDRPAAAPPKAAAPAVDPDAVRKAEAALARDGAEVQRAGTLLFEAVRAQEARKANVDAGIFPAVDPPRG